MGNMIINHILYADDIVLISPSSRGLDELSKSCKRFGSQLWVFIFLNLSELILNIKFGLELFSQTQISKIVLWLLLNLMISILGMIVSMKIYNIMQCRLGLVMKVIEN